ncbi:hypothetical protein [Actinocorallia aurantiaca]|uniref:hypothetical protein n=1 Tax=Actinocorallia aurantiaca TaxID=46204 RepID=UPI0031DB0931
MHVLIAGRNQIRGVAGVMSVLKGGEKRYVVAVGIGLLDDFQQWVIPAVPVHQDELRNSCPVQGMVGVQMARLNVLEEMLTVPAHALFSRE